MFVFNGLMQQITPTFPADNLCVERLREMVGTRLKIISLLISQSCGLNKEIFHILGNRMNRKTPNLFYINFFLF